MSITTLPSTGLLYPSLSVLKPLSMKVYSVGGGALREEREQLSSQSVYTLTTQMKIMENCVQTQTSYWEYVEQSEGKHIGDYLATV